MICNHFQLFVVGSKEMLDCFECYTIPSQVRGNKLMPLTMYVILEELGGMNGGGVKKGVPLYKNIISYNYNKISHTVVSIRGSHFFYLSG